MIKVMLVAAILSLLIAIIYILFQAFSPAFSNHLLPDVFVFYDRATYIWKNFYLTDLGHNEYQPGALLFFLLVATSFIFNSSFETFKVALFSVNIILIILTAFLFHKMKRTAGIILLSIFLIFLGPVLLFRFDLLVIFLLTLVFYLWEKKLFTAATLTLSFSILVKVYPIIFLPYLLFLYYRKKGIIPSLYLLSIFILTLSASFLVYSNIFQVNFLDSYSSFNYHNLKSVATESIWASFFYFANFIQGLPLPAMENAYGIIAVNRNEIYLPIIFYNYFWLIPVGLLNLLYFFIFWKKHREIDYKFIVLNILVFLVFYKVIFTQYWAWFLFLIPLLDLKTLLSRFWIVNIFLICIATILHTYVYPLNYNEWLDILTGKDSSVFLIWVMIISNFILPIVAIRIGYELFAKNQN